MSSLSLCKIGILGILFLLPFHCHAIEFPATTLTRTQTVFHLLNRAAYGPRPGEVELLSKPGELEKWFEQQLYPEQIDDALVEKKLQKLESVNLSTLELFDHYPIRHLTSAARLHVLSITKELGLQKIILAAESKREFEQVIVDFWFNHFSVDKKFPYYLSSYERDVIKKHAFGKFKDMLVASAMHPMMLYYLDNWRSSKAPPLEWSDDKKDFPFPPSGINENYARELLELHTVGVDGGYTQKDVENVALVFTGWTIINHNDNARFSFVEPWHDERDVTVMGQRFKGKVGIEEGKSLLNSLAAKPQTAKYISKKLCGYFISNPAPPTCVKKLSATYLSSDGDLRQMYRVLFSSHEFWDEKQVLTRMKSPLEFVASGMRAMGADMLTDTATVDSMYATMLKFGEPLYVCPSPAGYSIDNKTWISAGAVIGRNLSSPLLVKLARPTVHLNADTAKALLQGIFAKPLSLDTQATIVDALAKSPNDGLAMILATPEFQRH